MPPFGHALVGFMFAPLPHPVPPAGPGSLWNAQRIEVPDADSYVVTLYGKTFVHSSVVAAGDDMPEHQAVLPRKSLEGWGPRRRSVGGGNRA